MAFWQGALRDADEEIFHLIRSSVSAGAVSVDLLYRDHEGGQRTMSRFTLIRSEVENDVDSGWWTQLANHHALDAG